jgi:sugar lactone lactonase YvrE
VALIAAGGGSALTGRSIIVAFAGTGVGGRSGDGGPATKAQVGLPKGIAVDRAGNVYFSEGPYIRKVDTRGTITTIAGGGDRFTDGPVRGAGLADARGLAFDAQGTLHFAEATGRRVRKITADGQIVTVAGNSGYGAAGDGGPATRAALRGPDGIIFDKQGNLYISDFLANVIRKVTPAGTISTFAGVGSSGHAGDGGPATRAQLSAPQKLALDAKGNLYVAEYDGRFVRKITPGGTISTFAGVGVATGPDIGDGRPATKATLTYPTDVAIGRDGSVYIADWGAFRIRKVTPDGKIATIAGTGFQTPFGDGGPAGKAFIQPYSLALDGRGDLFIGTSGDWRMREIKNASPRGSFRASRNGRSLTVRFDASASRDPDGRVVSYSWTFGDGATGSGKRVTHTFPRPGAYRVVLRVTDDDGAVSTVARSVRVG